MKPYFAQSELPEQNASGSTEKTRHKNGPFGEFQGNAELVKHTPRVEENSEPRHGEHEVVEYAN